MLPGTENNMYYDKKFIFEKRKCHINCNPQKRWFV